MAVIALLHILQDTLRIFPFQNKTKNNCLVGIEWVEREKESVCACACVCEREYVEWLCNGTEYVAGRRTETLLQCRLILQ